MTGQVFLLALGLALVFEGLVFALAPRRLDELLRVLADLPFDARRLIGLLALLSGVGLMLTAHLMGR